MNENKRRRYILIGLAAVVVLVLVYGFLPETQEVETATVHRGPLRVLVEEEGETQVNHRYVLAAPQIAFAQRIEVEPGDRVEQGQPVVHLESPRSAILDPRTHAEALARVDAAEAALVEAEKNVTAATSVADQAKSERLRIERLFDGESATQQQLDQAVAADNQARARLDVANAAVEAARANLKMAQAVARGSGNGSNQAVAETLRSPVSGRVLSVFHKSEGPVNPGEPLIEIGDTDNLEVHVDVLSQDAVRIQPGMPVLLEQWGGDDPLKARVERVEPQGFTRVSSLGVEEKRVTVVAELESAFTEWETLGAGYRVLARFIVWESDDVLQAPTGALFRTSDSDGWGAFVIEDGRAVLRRVEVGHQSGLSAEVISGLAEGETVIVHPASTLSEGASVEPRR